MSVKDVVEELVCDGTVECERVGASNIYFSFPAKAKFKAKATVAKARAEAAAMTTEAEAVQKEIDALLAGQGDADRRKHLLHSLMQERKASAQLAAQLSEAEAASPQLLEQQRSAAKQAVDAANRWTDNFFTVKDWISDKSGGEFDDAGFARLVGLSPDLDYIAAP